MGEPTSLEEWTLDAVKELLIKGVFESDWFDFKVALPHKDAKSDKDRLRKTIAAFANTDGGFLIYGVKDDRNLSVEERLIGLDLAFDFPRHFGEYASGEKIAPSVEWEPRPEPIMIPKTGKLIHVIWIRRSWRKPHAILDGVRFTFPKRTHKGNEDMSYLEVRQAFQGTDFKRTKLSLLIAELEEMHEAADYLLDILPDKYDPEQGVLHQSWTTRFDTTLLDITLGDAFSFLTADPELWKLLNDVRGAARMHNATSEGIASIVHLSLNGTSGTYMQHYKFVREYCLMISKASLESSARILELMA